MDEIEINYSFDSIEIDMDLQLFLDELNNQEMVCNNKHLSINSSMLSKNVSANPNVLKRRTYSENRPTQELKAGINQKTAIH